jgi:sugar/nucleoside kinase (ribokinase family)
MRKISNLAHETEFSSMSLLVVGSVALDTIETPSAKHENVLGGSAVHFSYSASYFAPVRLVGVVGDDWPDEHTALLESRNIDTAGLRVVQGGKTFSWHGRYLPNMNDRETIDVQLNVFGDFDPVLPDEYRQCKFVFLANGSPRVQMNVLGQVGDAHLSVADTMDLWINTDRDGLEALLKQIDGLVLNDSEAKMLTGDDNLVRAGHLVREMGPKFVVIKKGEHGAMFFSQFETYVLPAYPTEKVVDPTGAGDSFAGGMMGYLAEQGDFEPKTLKRAMAYGIVAASFNVEDFGLARMKQLDRAELDRRLGEYQRMLSF